MDADEFEIIESKHRKEKKELQAKIQALKKTAKNDKTKKKELASEIVRLESELESKHKEELEACQKQLNHDNGSVHPGELGNVEESMQPKLSKAQKRRDKKSQQDRQREEQIRLQEKENLHGPRNSEIKSISERLKSKNLKIYPIASDGDCLYKAVSHQLEIRKQKEVSVAELRSNVSNYIRENKDDFLPFMSNPDTCDMLSDIEFDDYCDKVRDTKVWGGQLEIRALSNSLKCPISVIQATGPDSIEQGAEFQDPKLIITYHRHMFSLGEHYNSTVSDTGDDNIEQYTA